MKIIAPLFRLRAFNVASQGALPQTDDALTVLRDCAIYGTG